MKILPTVIFGFFVFHKTQTENIVSYQFIQLSALSFFSILVLMSIERYVAGYHPHYFREKVTTRLMMKVGAGALVYAVAIAGVFVPIRGNKDGACFYPDPDEVLPNWLRILSAGLIVFLLLLLPCVSTIVLNVFIIFKMRERQKNNSWVLFPNCVIVLDSKIDFSKFLRNKAINFLYSHPAFEAMAGFLWARNLCQFFHDPWNMAAFLWT